MITEIERLVEKLDALEARDMSRRTFGSDEHGCAREPVAEQALAALESAIGFALPEDYRQWMLHVGAGAGPDQGLWAPAAALKQIECTPDGSGGLIGDPTAMAPRQIEDMAHRLRSGIAPGDAGITTDTIRGAVPIGHRGCNGYTYLFVAGAYAGRVFAECCDCIGEPWTAAAAFSPACAPGTLEPPTFFGWLDDWLDRALAEIAGT